MYLKINENSVRYRLLLLPSHLSLDPPLTIWSTSLWYNWISHRAPKPVSYNYTCYVHGLCRNKSVYTTIIVIEFN